MEHRIIIFLRCLVVVFFVIVRRLDHHVGHVPIFQIEQFPERQVHLLAPEEVERRIELTIERPFQFFGLLCVFEPDCQMSMT